MSDEACPIGKMHGFASTFMRGGEEHCDFCGRPVCTEPSTVTDEGLVDWIANELAPELAPDDMTWNECVDKGRAIARNIVEASSHTALLREIEVLREALAKAKAVSERGDISLGGRVATMQVFINAALSRPLVGGGNPKP